MTDSYSHFRFAILQAGLKPPSFLTPGKFYRFPGRGKHTSNRSGWCILFSDKTAGCFGDWASGFSSTWKAAQNKPLSRDEKREFDRKIKTAKYRALIDRNKKQSIAANRASKIWNMAFPCPNNHPYVISKCIIPYGVKIHRDALVLPIVALSGQLSSLQFISPDGSKRLLSNGRKKGCFIRVSGDNSAPSRILICEGWATGCTLAEDDPKALVLAAIDSNNLKPVAIEVRKRWPSADLRIMADDDRQTDGNPGVTKALEAAACTNATLFLPDWPVHSPLSLTDFNDLHVFLLGDTGD